MHYLYRTYRGKERSVTQYLTDMGYKVFLPTLEGEPLFPTYLFVDEDNADFYELNRAPGAIGIVNYEGVTPKVPDALVDSYRNTEWARSEECAPGSQVMIKEGPFKWQQAIVKAKKHDRIIVLMTILNQPQSLEFALSEVEAA